MQDISRLVSANDKLRQAAKMEAIGRLTGGIAHAFNNTLQVIQGCIESLELDVPASGDAQISLDAIKRAADSAGTLTHQLLAFARRQPLSPQIVDVARLVDGLDALLRGTLGAVINLEIRRPITLWAVRVDPAQLQDAIINLSINARDAMPSGGRLTIEAANRPVRKPESDPFGEIKPGNYVVISVSDTGKGIPKELLGNVFEPFFSTKSAGRGTGLGLAMVYGFVNQSGGHVKITSEVGRGTTVRLFLPSAGEANPSPGEPQDAATTGSTMDLPGGAESILVVEDTDGVREVVVADLRRLGYRVSAAADGPAALDLIERALEPDMLLTDVQLPGGMDGVRLAEHSRQQRPNMAVLFMSGYVEDLAAYGEQLDQQTNLLRKPFSRAQLANRVRARLDEAQNYRGQNSSAA
jgi:nitrogen-specific signal transduction histidine kinase/ActR/RegA family two-component response regulator